LKELGSSWRRVVGIRNRKCIEARTGDFRHELGGLGRAQIMGLLIVGDEIWCKESGFAPGGTAGGNRAFRKPWLGRVEEGFRVYTIVRRKTDAGRGRRSPRKVRRTATSIPKPEKKTDWQHMLLVGEYPPRWCVHHKYTLPIFPAATASLGRRAARLVGQNHQTARAEGLRSNLSSR